MTAGVSLPRGVTVFERGWLSSNCVLLQGRGPTVLVDSGYCVHAAQTVALVQQGLGAAPLDILVNTHLHSDHCGGNAALKQTFPALQTVIPPGHAEAVRRWDAEELTYAATGQSCPRFSFDALLQPGSAMRLGAQEWEIHAAPGHDPHSVVLFEPESRTLISADALWEQGFGVVFPELEGLSAFDEVASTLDLIERLNPALIIPGHGRPFTDLGSALAVARRRLAGFQSHPARHVRYGAKVLLKFKLLEVQQFEPAQLANWVQGVRYFHLARQQEATALDWNAWLSELIADLLRSGAARLEDGVLINSD